MVSEEVTIHWHGQHQKLNPYMDGVPYVTQCPIASGSSFRYRFKAENSGTHFWHSHIGKYSACPKYNYLLKNRRSIIHCQP